MLVSIQDTRSIDAHEARISTGRYAPALSSFLKEITVQVDRAFPDEPKTVTGTYSLDVDETYGFRLINDGGWFVAYVDRTEFRVNPGARSLSTIQIVIETAIETADMFAEIYREDKIPEDIQAGDLPGMEPGVLRCVRLKRVQEQKIVKAKPGLFSRMFRLA